MPVCCSLTDFGVCAQRTQTDLLQLDPSLQSVRVGIHNLSVEVFFEPFILEVACKS